MKNLITLSFIFLLLLSACAGSATPATAPQPVEEAAPPAAEEPYPGVEAAEPPTETNPYPAAESTEGAAAGVIVYNLVAAESALRYEVGETFISQDNRFATAIGVTTDIVGSVTIDPATPQNSRVSVITADISKFKSDSDRRDNKIRTDFLESAKFPLVTFTPTEIIGLPENPKSGESYTFQIVGDTTIRETTLPLTFEVTLTVTEEMVSGTASTAFLMSDFGFGPISIAGILNTEDEVKISFDFVARP